MLCQPSAPLYLGLLIDTIRGELGLQQKSLLDCTGRLSHGLVVRGVKRALLSIADKLQHQNIKVWKDFPAPSVRPNHHGKEYVNQAARSSALGDMPPSVTIISNEWADRDILQGPLVLATLGRLKLSHQGTHLHCDGHCVVGQKLGGTSSAWNVSATTV